MVTLFLIAWPSIQNLSIYDDRYILIVVSKCNFASTCIGSIAIEERGCSAAHCSSVVLDSVIVIADHPFCLCIVFLSFFLCSYVCLPYSFAMLCSVVAEGFAAVVAATALSLDPKPQMGMVCLYNVHIAPNAIVLSSLLVFLVVCLTYYQKHLQLCCFYLLKLTVYITRFPENIYNPISRSKRKREDEEGDISRSSIPSASNKKLIADEETPEKPRLIIYGVPKYWSSKTTTKWVQTTGCPKGKVRKGQGQNFAIISFEDEVRVSIYQSLLAWVPNAAVYVFRGASVVLNGSFTNCFEIYGE